MASNGQDEVPFEYSLKNASDSDIEGVLEKSDKNLAYHRVVLSTNKLTLTPKISRYPQFQLVSHLNLWDNQITNISKENIPRNVQELDLGRNQIENVPSFAEFLHLRKLSLGQNKITVLSKDCIPPNVEILDLNGNKGLILPELSEHKKLRELYLMDCALTDFREEHCSYNLRVLFLDRNNLKKVVNIRSAKNLKHLYQRNNAIQHVNINHLPLGLEFLNLEDNGIKEFGNLKQFTSLKCLKVRGNKITRFVGLPVCLTDISLRFNPLQILDEECFPSEAVYNVWISNITDQQKSDLKQPPWNILSLGFDHVLRYFGALNDNDPNFYRPASSTKVVLPDPGYHNRFEVERKGERLTNSRNRLVLVGGTGVGKTSLTETLVHRKSVLTDKIKDRTKVVNIKTLKLTNQDTFKVFDQGGHEIYTITNTLFVSKKSTVFVCHDVSQCDEKSVEATVSIFKRTLQQQPKNNINLVLTHSDMLEDEEVTRNKNKLVSEVQQFLQKEVESMEKVQRATADSKEDTTKAEEVLHLYKNVKSSMKVFVVSSKTLAGIDQLKQFLTQKAESDRVVIPSVWTKMYEMIATKKEHCLVYHNVQKEYQHFFTGFQKLVKRKEKMVAECDDCLRYYHDIGLVFWFEEHPVLKNYIFHDIEFLIKVFRAILNHDFPTTLVYKEDQALQESFKEVEYESILHQYENEGLLPLSMMKFLWKHDLESEDVNALLELMKSFDICFEILSAEESKMQEPLYFFPWFVRIKTVPANFNIEDPMIVDNDTVSLMFECVFHNNIPVNICEILCVRLQKYAVMYHYHGQRQAWRDGLMITINRTECYIFRNDATSTISCCVRSPVEDIADAWTALQYAHTELETILAQWYGVIRSIHVVCSHCDFKSIIPPHRWPSREVWLADLKTKYVRCPKQLGENVPAVLVLPVVSSKNIKAAVEYMKTEWTDESSGEPLSQVTKTRLRSMQSTFLNVVNTQPVTDELFVSESISQVHKQEVEALPTEYAKARYLLDRVLLRGSTATLKAFIVALNKTGYHTNLQLADVLDMEGDSAQSYDAEDGKSTAMSAFLTSDEVNHMRKHFYQTFIDNADVEAIIPHLVEDTTLDRYQEDLLQGKKTVTEKARYLMDGVLFRGCYDTVNRFRKALKQTEQTTIAELLPIRN